MSEMSGAGADIDGQLVGWLVGWLVGFGWLVEVWVQI
jgi:hypothetical protein